MPESSTLVIVEDDLVDSLSIRRELRRHVLDCRIVVMTDPHAALDHLQTELDPDALQRTVVSLDLSLPGESGFWLLDRMQLDPRLRKVPVVVITGSEDDADQKRALQLGARAAFSKSMLSGAVDTLALAIGLLPEPRHGSAPYINVAPRGRALVIDDDRADSIQIQRQIEQVAGPQWVVDVAHDGDEGIASLGQRPYDVVFLDMNLPRRRGTEIMREMLVRLGEELPPVVAVTGAGSENTVREMFHLGATDYLPKSMINRAALNRVLALIYARSQKSVEKLRAEFASVPETEGTPATGLVMLAGSAGALQIATRALSRRYELGENALLYLTHASRRPDSSLLTVMQNVNANFEWARPGEMVAAGHFYVAPPGFDIGFAEQRFRMIPADAHPSSVPSLDIAYRMATEVYGNKLSVFVLAGLSDDGAAGVAQAAAVGARVFVVDPNELGSNGVMGQAVVDFVPSTRIVSIHDVETELEQAVGA